MFGKIKTLRELFEIELRYAYDCETKLVNKGLPEMIGNAGSSELRPGFSSISGKPNNMFSGSSRCSPQ